MNRVYNFSAGPSMLPLPVLEKAQAELICYGESGMSVMEMSHRSADYMQIIEKAEADLRKLMQIPGNYKVLFLQGGASTQFASIPLNLIGTTKKADYVVSGQFSEKAYKEAIRMGFDAKCIASSKADTFSYIPAFTKDDIRPDAAYVHVCYNNTIFGTKFPEVPDTGDIPLVADMSSCILSEPVDVSKFGVIYAGAQKNMAPAGLTVVIVRDDLLDRALPGIPTMLEWKVMVENDSMYNTPPCYAIYMAGLVYEYLLEHGGLEAIAKINYNKANMLYDYLDTTDYYITHAQPAYRSIMNVTFKTGDEALDKKFASEAAKAGFKNLKGHRSVGGMRASIYNAMPTEGIVDLIAFMKKFEAENPKA